MNGEGNGRYVVKRLRQEYVAERGGVDALCVVCAAWICGKDAWTLGVTHALIQGSTGGAEMLWELCRIKRRSGLPLLLL